MIWYDDTFVNCNWVDTQQIYHINCSWKKYIIIQTIASSRTQNTLVTQIWVSAQTLRNASLKKKIVTELQKNIWNKNAYLNSINKRNLRIHATTLRTLCINARQQIFTFCKVQFKVTEFATLLHFYMLRIILTIQDSKFPNESSVQSGIF
jgi:hypothetical protein